SYAPTKSFLTDKSLGKNIFFMFVRFCGWLFVAAFVATFPFQRMAWAGFSRDTKKNLEKAEKLKDAPLDAQMNGCGKNLKDHPNSSFREEINNNVKNLEDLLANTDPAQQKEKRDTERYLKAVEFAKKLSPSDQIELWEQFLSENPKSLYTREARKNLENL